MNAIDIEKIVFAQLSTFGFKHHSAGFRYLCTGLQLALEQPSILNEMTERFYPAVPRFRFYFIGVEKYAEYLRCL
ncbi:MAG: sporulation initiation factor Spo0A C-terminal domain-containing protein [Christensenellales bacterium]